MTLLLLGACLAPFVRAPGQPPELPRVLFLTHSAGFVHDVVKRGDDDGLAVAERGLLGAAKGVLDVVASQDCAMLEPASLAGFDAVVLYTTGELPVPDATRAGLLDWVRGGGAFVGVHCATDTFYEYPPYLAMVGGTFDGHPWHQEVLVTVEDTRHPATAHLGARFPITDEIYQFRDFHRHPVRVLASLDPASVEIEKGKRADGDYALSWWKDYGQGRVFYTALGHRPEVWDDARFLEHLLGGIRWAIEGPDLGTPAPEGAVALDGLGAWRRRDGEEAGWRLEEGELGVVAGAGDVVSRAVFGDGLLHVEFRTPPSSEGITGQARGNSGVYVQGRYEVQVLDSFGVPLSPEDHGRCAALYGIRAPSVDATRPPERWQVYDIEFRAPRFGPDGARTEAARVSVWHDGVLVHDDVELPGPTPGGLGEDEVAQGPLLLQDHGDAVRYRNVWVMPRGSR